MNNMSIYYVLRKIGLTLEIIRDFFRYISGLFADKNPLQTNSISLENKKCKFNKS